MTLGHILMILPFLVTLIVLIITEPERNTSRTRLEGPTVPSNSFLVSD